MAKKIRVMIVDDNVVVRIGISSLLRLEPEMIMVGEAANGLEAVDLAGSLCPDVILMDINMPVMNGLEATRIIHSKFPHIRIVGLSMYDEKDLAAAMIAAGASAYQSKSDSAGLILSAIRGEIE